MITDEVVEAIDQMIEMCNNEEHKKGIESVREMLCEFNDPEWYSMNEEERARWIKQFFGCERV